MNKDLSLWLKMSEEEKEKEALEILLFKRKEFEFNQAGYNHHLSFTITECKEVLDPVLNLIEEQQKKLDAFIDDINSIGDDMISMNRVYFNNNFINKDKIRDKIKELKSIGKYQLDHKDLYLEQENIDLLEELLGEEKED